MSVSATVSVALFHKCPKNLISFSFKIRSGKDGGIDDDVDSSTFAFGSGSEISPGDCTPSNVGYTLTSFNVSIFNSRPL